MQGRKAPTVIAALLSGIVALSICGSPAAAQEPVIVYGESENLRTERVAFADLDLASASGQSRLSNRVGGAIERVCLIDLGRDGLQDRDYYRCAGDAWDAAEPQIANARQLAMAGKSVIGAAIVVSGR